MIEFFNTYAAELLSTGTILAAVAYPFAKRIIADKNMIAIFDKAKKSISDSNNIKINIIENITKITETVENIKKTAVEQTQEFERVILEFQDSEMYKKMLLSADQVEAIHETIKVKDETIALLGSTLKQIKLDMAEINNKLKG